jgi:hypothetical protein
MGFGVAFVHPDRQAHPEWDSGTAEERLTMPAGRLLAVLRVHALPVTLIDGLQEISDQGGTVVVICHGDAAPVQILMNGRRYPLPLGACASVHSLIAGSVAATADISPRSATAPAAAVPPSAPAAPPVPQDAATTVRAAIVQARVNALRGHVETIEPDPHATQDALARAYS